MILGLAPPPTRRDELAEFLRHHRERTSPETVGLSASGRRRTPGLRREEISQLAGVGLSWYTWLEQGRDITPSSGVIDALARVLDLDPHERAHLFHLAGVALPAPGDDYPTQAPAELRDLVLGLEPNPAYLLGPRTDVLVWNAAAARMLGTPSRAPDGAQNLLWWLFTDRGTHGPTWSGTARNTLARFRAEHARRYGDPAFLELIEALLAASPAFRELWPRHEVLDAQLGTKVIDHPELGRLTVRHMQSIPTSHPDLRLTQFVPPTRPLAWRWNNRAHVTRSRGGPDRSAAGDRRVGAVGRRQDAAGGRSRGAGDDPRLAYGWTRVHGPRRG